MAKIKIIRPSWKTISLLKTRLDSFSSIAEFEVYALLSSLEFCLVLQTQNPQTDTHSFQPKKIENLLKNHIFSYNFYIFQMLVAICGMKTCFVNCCDALRVLVQHMI